MEISELTFEYFLHGYDAELERSRALDSKTANLMGFTSVLSGLMIPFSAIAEGELHAVLESHPILSLCVKLLFILAVLLLFAALVCFYLSSRVRRYKQMLRYTKEDIAKWDETGEAKVREMLTERLQRFWQDNKDQNDNKAAWTQQGFLLLMLGGGAVVLSVCGIIAASIMAA